MSSIASKGISIAMHKNEYLAEGAGTVDAVVTVETGADFAVPTIENLTACPTDTRPRLGE